MEVPGLTGHFQAALGGWTLGEPTALCVLDSHVYLGDCAGC